MTLFGTSLDGGQIAGLVALLATLVLWLAVLGRERGYTRWFKAREAARGTPADAERGVPPASSDKPPTGPWG